MQAGRAVRSWTESEGTGLKEPSRRLRREEAEQKVKPVKNHHGVFVLWQIPLYVEQLKVFLSSPPSGSLPVISCTCQTPLHFHYFSSSLSIYPGGY